MRSERTRLLVEIALTVALCAVLNLIRLRLPINLQGGTISLVMVPLFVIALRRGFGPGIIAGALYGFIDLIMEPQVYAWIQVLLDYPIAYGLLGLAGVWSRPYRKALGTAPLKAAGIGIAAMVIGGLARLAAHWTSGIVFFGSFAPEGQPVWLYSLVYNASYLLPSVIGSIIVALIVLPLLERAVPTVPRSPKGA
ncbi:MAG: energy-coupled thiamine transporter ThiT [Coriobacteriia bacterium]